MVIYEQILETVRGSERCAPATPPLSGYAPRQKSGPLEGSSRRRELVTLSRRRLRCRVEYPPWATVYIRTLAASSSKQATSPRPPRSACLTICPAISSTETERRFLEGGELTEEERLLDRYIPSKIKKSTLGKVLPTATFKPSKHRCPHRGNGLARFHLSGRTHSHRFRPRRPCAANRSKSEHGGAHELSPRLRVTLRAPPVQRRDDVCGMRMKRPLSNLEASGPNE